MMEQPDSCECHGHAVFVAALDDQIISYRSARLCDIADAAFVSPLNVVGKGEEGIGPQGYTGHLR